MNNNRILLVEDDIKLSQLIAEYLPLHGYAVNCESQGDKAVYRILHENYFLVILDINLPGLSGLQICKLIRKDFSGLILMLTASENEDNQIIGLEIGADDYVQKPIHPKVLLARIQALARRINQPTLPVKQLQFGELSIDLVKRLVILQNEIIDLSEKEFDLLALLATNAGICLSRDNIMQALRGINHDGLNRIIDLRISYLRHKLKDNANVPYRIMTLRGKGYVFQPDAWG